MNFYYVNHALNTISYCHSARERAQCIAIAVKWAPARTIKRSDIPTEALKRLSARKVVAGHKGHKRYPEVALDLNARKFYFIELWYNRLTYVYSHRLRSHYLRCRGSYRLVKRRDISPAQLRALHAVQPVITKGGFALRPSVTWGAEQ